MLFRRTKGGAVLRLILILAAAALLALAYGLWKASNRSEAALSPAAPPASHSDTAARAPPASATEVKEETAAGGQGATAPPAQIPPREAYGLDTPAHEILAGMRKAWECYAASGCRLGADRDPRAEYFEADRRLAAGMQALAAQHRTGRIGDAELAAGIHEVLGYDSGRGRAAAIGALAQLPPAREHLHALFAALDQHHDEKLFELALNEFERYAQAGYATEVDGFLKANLRTGAYFPARTIARELDRFLTPENVAGYRRLAAELPKDSRRAALLRQSLREYEARRPGAF